MGPGAAKRRRLAAAAAAAETGLSAEEEAAAVAAVARKALAHWGRHGGAPLLRTDLTKVALEGWRSGGRQAKAAVIAKAAGLLAQAAGLELVEVSRTRTGRNSEQERRLAVKGQAPPAIKCFFLRSLVPPALRQDVVDTLADRLEMGFAAVCVALVSMAGGHMPEETLYQYLGDLGLSRGARHPVYNDVEDCVKRLCGQRYLMREKKPGQGGDGGAGGGEGGHEFWELSLAEGALEELGHEGVSQIISQVLQGSLGKVGSRENPEIVPESPDGSPGRVPARITLSD